MNKQYTQIGLDEKNHKKLKRMALELETSMSNIIEQALEKEFEKFEKEQGKKLV